MGEFFKPWRRKIGLLTLLMACVFMAGWVRSEMKSDSLGDRSFYGREYHVDSAAGRMEFYRVTPFQIEGSFYWKSKNVTEGMSNEGDLWSGLDVKWRWDFAGCHFGAFVWDRFHFERFIVPYWSIVIPLTLLSAFLFLSTPPKSNQTKNTGPKPTEGT